VEGGEREFLPFSGRRKEGRKRTTFIRDFGKRYRTHLFSEEGGGGRPCFLRKKEEKLIQSPVRGERKGRDNGGLQKKKKGGYDSSNFYAGKRKGERRKRCRLHTFNFGCEKGGKVQAVLTGVGRERKRVRFLAHGKRVAGGREFARKRKGGGSDYCSPGRKKGEIVTSLANGEKNGVERRNTFHVTPKGKDTSSLRCHVRDDPWGRKKKKKKKKNKHGLVKAVTRQKAGHFHRGMEHSLRDQGRRFKKD